MRRGVLFVLAVLVGGCAAKQAAPAATGATPHAAALVAPPPGADMGPALDSAGQAATLYSHETIDPESAMPTAGGIIRVRAPIEVAKTIAVDFDRYWELNPDIETSRIVERAGDATDVYLRVPTVIPDTYIWAVVRFAPVAASEGVAYKGTFVQGNLDDLRISWRLVPRGDETLAQMEVLADPRLPLPKKWIVRDTRLGIQWMLERFRDKAERYARSRRGASDGTFTFPVDDALE